MLQLMMAAAPTTRGPDLALHAGITAQPRRTLEPHVSTATFFASSRAPVPPT